MAEAPANGKELSHSARANAMNEQKEEHAYQKKKYSWKLDQVLKAEGARGGVVVKAQTGRSRVRFPMLSFKFSSDIILQVALWP
jgi:hypothetical protein